MYQLDEQSDVFVDACAADQNGQLLFLSVYGRDTSIQQLMARLHQRSSQGGVDQLTLRRGRSGTVEQMVVVGDPARLDKATARLPRTGLLGNLVHTWIFDGCLRRPNMGAGTGWHLDSTEGAPEAVLAARELEQSWRLVKELADVPLLDHWALTVMAHLESVGAVTRPRCVGPVKALHVRVPDDFTKWVSEQVRDGVLTQAPISVPAAQVPLRLVA